MSERSYIACTVKRLPPHKHVQAAARAIKINPANAPALRAAGTLGITAPEHLALLTSKYWGPAGVKLTVSFMDNPDAETRRKILAMANRWNARGANVEFVETRGAGQVRIARAESGYWSYLGTDVLSIPTGEATMNLQGFTASTPDSEYLRVPTHEFGHTLGFPHEHERPEIIQLLDPDKVIAEFERTQGWSREEVIQQILTSLTGLDPRSLPADVRSIMAYEFRGSVTKNGQPIPGGSDINDEDYKLVGILYPKADTGGGGGGGGNPPGPPAGSAAVLRAALQPGWYMLTPTRAGGRYAVFQAVGQLAPGRYGPVAAGADVDSAGAGADFGEPPVEVEGP